MRSITAKQASPRADIGPRPPGAEARWPVFHYDKARRDYWRLRPDGDYVPASEKDLRRHCKRAGLLVERVEPNGLTAFENQICVAQDNCAVDNVCALAGHKPGIFTADDGRRILVPHAPRLIVPKAGPMDNFEGFFSEFLGPEQTPHFCAWAKVALEDLRSLNPRAWRHHQMLVFVGAAGCGKSFCQRLITALLGGRVADPYLAMVGRTDFNEHLAEAEHLAMEDKQALRDIKSRLAFGTAIKQLTVSADLAIHGKGKKQFTAPCFHRLTLSVNDDGDNITCLPLLDDSIADKLMLFRCSRATMLPDYAENWRRFEVELPALVHFLLNTYRIPEDMQSVRFGVKHYHHPAVVELLQQFEPHVRFREVLDATLFSDGDLPVSKLTASQIQQRLCDGCYGAIARQLMPNATVCGLLLAKCERDEPDRFTRTAAKGVTRWTIRAPRSVSQ